MSTPTLDDLAREHRDVVEAFTRKYRIGLLTLLFTDLVDSTRLKQDHGDEKAVFFIQQHHARLRQVLGKFSEAEEIGTAGDSFFIVFAKPSDAVHFALLLQVALRALSTELRQVLLERVGIHVGEVMIEQGESGETEDLYGLQVDTAARIMSLAQGDQILLSRPAFDTARQSLRRKELVDLAEVLWLNHGPFVLKGVNDPVEICEAGESGKGLLRSPIESEEAHRLIRPDDESVLGWRPAAGLKVPATAWVLQDKLGEGGFGEVWTATHAALKHIRVLKFCFRADRVRSLKREISLLRLLRQRVGERRDIIAIQDACLEQPPFYLVLDYVQGRDLKTWAESNPEASIETKLDLIAQAADALQAAHDAGIVHRDIKPTNILVSDEGAGPRVVLTDFGIGKVLVPDALGPITRQGFTQTVLESGRPLLAGTLMYLAPELLAGAAATKQSDLYALGVVCYQLTVGDFSRPLTMDWFREISHSLLRDYLTRCFTGKSSERFPSAASLAQELRALPKPRAYAPSAGLTVRFWGVRGETPTPGTATVFYGGNTACVEVRVDDAVLILDAGSGIRALGERLAVEFKNRPLHCTLLLSHTHWDHIQGFPFFAPAQDPKNEIRILGFEGARTGLGFTLAGQMESPYFPISLTELKARIRIEELTGLTFNIGPVKARAEFSNHPGMCAGFRLDTICGSVVYLPDHEPYQLQREYTLEAHDPDSGITRPDVANLERRIIDLLKDADIAIVDSQYTMDEYKTHVGWGHGCLEDSVRMAMEAGVKELFLFHHDPNHDDACISMMVERARQLANAASSPLHIEAGREGLEVVLPAVRPLEEGSKGVSRWFSWRPRRS